MARGKGMASMRYDLSWGDSRYHFGSPAERAARTRNNQWQPPATAFKQIGPADEGGSLNSKSPGNKSGHFKFTPGV